MTKVLVLGGTGMLGHAVLKEFKGIDSEVLWTSRTADGIYFDVLLGSTDGLEKLLSVGDVVVNCLGITKSHINETNPSDVARALFVNSLFPNQLACIAEKVGFKVIQIATDCVFSGSEGDYLETDLHDAKDVYGKTKSLGEPASEQVMHLRVSTIGRESGRSTMLMEWVLNQPKDAVIPGFTDHFWNGITTNHFAKIARGIIEQGSFTPGIQHIMPADKVTKADLVQEIANAFDRADIHVTPWQSRNPIDRTLATSDPDRNAALWKGAGYLSIPSIKELISEISR